MTAEGPSNRWFQTVTGRTIDLDTPAEEWDVNIVDIGKSLAKVCRWGGHTRDLTFYSVAQHCTVVALAAYRDTKNVELARHLLLHDAAEAYTQDMISPHKRFIRSMGEPSRYDLLEHIAQKAVALKFGLPVGFCHLPDVVNYDLRILHTENIQLCEDMRDEGRRVKWRATLPEPLDVRLVPWTVHESFLNFTLTYTALFQSVSASIIEALLDLVPLRSGFDKLEDSFRGDHEIFRPLTLLGKKFAEMTDTEKEEQRRCFAHGNVAMSNPNVTREMVDEAAERMRLPELFSNAKTSEPNKEEK